MSGTKKLFIVLGLCLGGLFLSCGVVGCSVFSTLNREASIRMQAKSQLDVNKANYDKMWKVIQQKTQITKASSNLQKELVDSLVEGRAANFVKIVTESNPESAFSREQFNSLANSIEAQRTEFFREQKKLIDFTRAQQTMFEKPYSGFVLAIFGKEALKDPVVVTSSKTESVFELGAEGSGLDDDVNLEL